VLIVIAQKLVKNAMMDGNFLMMELALILSVLFLMKIQMNVLFVNLDIIMFGTDLLKIAILQFFQLLMVDSNMTLILFQTLTYENAKKEKNTLIETILEYVILVIMDLLDRLIVPNVRLTIGV